jgi:hypothetical protein
MGESYCKPIDPDVQLCQSGIKEDVVFWGSPDCSAGKVALDCCAGTTPATVCHSQHADFSVGTQFCL